MHGIPFEIEMFKSYINYVEEYFLEKNDEIVTDFKALELTSADDPIRETMEDYHQSYYDVVEDGLIDDHFFNSEFTQRFRYAIVIQLYSLMEKHFNRILPYYTKHNDIDEGSLRGNLLKKANKILKPQLTLSDLKEYKTLQIFTEVRNKIVHHGGKAYDTDLDRKNLNRLLQMAKTSSVRLTKTRTLKGTVFLIEITDKDYLHGILSAIGSMLSYIDIKLRKYKADIKEQ